MQNSLKFQIAPEKASYFFARLTEAFASPISPRDRFMRMRPILDELFKVLVEKERASFTTLFNRMVYIFDVDQTASALARDSHKVRQAANKVAHELEFEPGDNDVRRCGETLAALIAYFSKTEIPNETQKVLQGKSLQSVSTAPVLEKAVAIQPVQHKDVETAETAQRQFTEEIEFLRAVVLDVGEMTEHQRENGTSYLSRRIYVEPEIPENLPRVALMLYDANAELDIWKYATIHALHLKLLKNDLYQLSGHEFVIEPDILINASDLSECFQSGVGNPNIFFLNRFKARSVNVSAVAGTVIGNIFAQLIKNPEISFHESYQNAIRENAFAISGFEREDIEKQIFQKAKVQFNNLRDLSKQLQHLKVDVEPTYIAPEYGLLGRLDALVTEGQDRLSIIELKSGKPPANNVWNNNQAQAIAYITILMKVFLNAVVTGSILYSGSEDLSKALRNVPFTDQLVSKLIHQRNALVCIEHAHTQGDHVFLRALDTKNLNSLPPFLQHDADWMTANVRKADDVERAFLKEYVSFIARESWIARLGSSDPNSSDMGFSGLWLGQPSTKEFQVIAGLKALHSDEGICQFHITDEYYSVTRFRAGDIVVVYPQQPDGSTAPQLHRLIKAVISEYDRQRSTITIKPNDRNLKPEIFHSNDKWVIEADFLERNFNLLYSSLITFIGADPEKRKQFLGRTEPRASQFVNKPKSKVPLNPTQEALWQKALEAEDYFLLQGPPGTGKTSRVIPALVRYLLDETKEDILLLAFTNRAVLEICNALDKFEIDYVKLGSGEDLTNPQLSMDTFAEEHSPDEVKWRFDRARVVVGTVSKCLGMAELFIRKKFHTTIVDEASQLLEPHLAGILTQTRRFILIGDEKQLPAVVTQSAAMAMIDDPGLHAIGIRDLRMSVFERLLRNAKVKKWNHAFGQLAEQARMHVKIAHFANERYYSKSLKALSDWQSLDEGVLSTEFTEDGRALHEKRVLFVPSKSTSGTKRKVQEEEARLAAAWSKRVADAYKLSDKALDKSSLGIITPFRAQIGEIYRQLDPELKGIISVDTVERYQGSEREIIIFSLALTHPAQLESVQSLTEIDGIEIDRKLNVAITRAKQYLIILGDPSIMRISPHFAALIEWASVPTSKGILSRIQDFWKR